MVGARRHAQSQGVIREGPRDGGEAGLVRDLEGEGTRNLLGKCPKVSSEAAITHTLYTAQGHFKALPSVSS